MYYIFECVYRGKRLLAYLHAARKGYVLGVCIVMCERNFLSHHFIFTSHSNIQCVTAQFQHLSESPGSKLQGKRTESALLDKRVQSHKNALKVQIMFCLLKHEGRDPVEAKQ